MFKDKRPGKWALLGFLLLLALLGLILFFGMQAKAEKPSVSAKAAIKTERVLDIREAVSPGGIKYWIVENHKLPIVAVKFAFLDSGSALDPKDKQGLARLLSNTMDEGAGELDSEAFQKELNDHSIELSFNAGRDTFGGTLQSLSRHKEKAFDLLGLALNSPRFDEEALARMKAANITRIRSSMSEPDWIAARLMNDRAFEGHTYAYNSGGTLSGLNAIKRDDLKKFKTAAFAKDRLKIAISGDITITEAGKAVDRIFGALPATSTAKPIPDAASVNGGKIFAYSMPIPQTIMSFSSPSIDHTDKDYYALQLLNYVYGGAGFGSRLMDSAREKGGLTYGIYSSIEDYRHADRISVTTSTKNESAGRMMKIVDEEMTRLKNTVVADKELQDAKAYLTGSLLLSLTSTNSIAGAALGLQINDYPSDYLDTYKTRIEEVTSDDVRRTALRVFNTNTMTTVLVGQPENIQNAIAIREIPNVQ